MLIIGHRGAKGLELENTLSSLRRAVKEGSDGVEFDVRATKDHQLVLCHDKHLKRVSNSRARVADLDLKELRKIKLNNGETVPTLTEALQAVKGKIAFVEPKVGGIAEELLKVIEGTPGHQIVITTFNLELAKELEKQRPDVTVYLAEHLRPVEILHFIRHAKADGLTLNSWLLNPLTYRLVKRRGLKLMVYTVNSPFRYWFIRKFYPEVDICTDYPDRFAKSGKATD